MTKSENALLSELTDLVGADSTPTPRHHRRRQVLTVAATVAATTALAAGLVLAPSQQNPGYALERSPTGRSGSPSTR